jgi:hypothetical protein
LAQSTEVVTLMTIICSPFSQFDGSSCIVDFVHQECVQLGTRRRRFKLSSPPSAAPKQKSYLIRVGSELVPMTPFDFKGALQLRRITHHADEKAMKIVGTATERIKLHVVMTEQGTAVIRFFAAQSAIGPRIRTSWSLIERAKIYFT